MRSSHFILSFALIGLVWLGPVSAAGPKAFSCPPAAAAVPGAPANDECSTATPMPLDTGTFSATIDTTSATPTVMMPCFDQGDRSVYFTFVPAYQGWMYFRTTGTTYAHVIHPYPAASDTCSNHTGPGDCFMVPNPSSNSGEFRTWVEAGRRMMVVVAAPRGSAGGTLEFTARYEPDIQRLLIGFGDSPDDSEGGWTALRGYAPNFIGTEQPRQIDWPAYAAGGGGVHAASGDTDNDGVADRVLGLGRGGQGFLRADAPGTTGRVWLQVPWPAYSAVNGETFPAVGNIDADAAAEIVVGLGHGGGGFFFVFDDALNGFAPLGWGRVPWAAYSAGVDGSTRPAIGDVDGDGTGEIILGLGPGSDGYLAVLNGPQSGFSLRTWLHVWWPSYTGGNGETFPAAGDLDGDGAAEIVIGLGMGGGGFFAIHEDEASGFALTGWRNVGWAAYNAAHGAIHPAVGNVDMDAAAEIVVGLGEYAQDGPWLRAFDDAGSAFAPMAWINAEYWLGPFGPTLAGRGTFPAIGEIR